MWAVVAVLLAAIFVLLVRGGATRVRLRGRVGVVTGAANGLGFEIACALAAKGVHLVLWDTRERGLQRAARKIREQHQGAVLGTCVLDVADEAAVAREAAQLRATLPPGQHVSLLVNNAGVVTGRPLLELHPSDVRRTVSVNLLAHFWTLRAFLPDMLACNDGAVVTMSSAMGLIGGAALTDYCASKWGVLGLHDSLQLELRRGGHSGVRATAVLPYATATGMFAGVFESPKEWKVVRWMFPLLSPVDVAARTVAAVERGDALLVLPTVLRFAALILRCLPAGLYFRALELAGGRHGMDHFRGRGRDPLAHRPSPSQPP